MTKKCLVIILICFLVCGCSISHSKKEYYCENGTLVNDVCKVEEVKEAKLVCPEDAVLEKDKCKFTDMEIDPSIGDKVCANGYSYYEKMCISDEGEDRIPAATCPEPESADYKIEPGYLTCFKKKCTKKDSTGKCTNYVDDGEVEPEIKYSCPSGYRYVYYKCRKIYYVKYEPKCPAGELVDGKCVFYSYDEPDTQCDEDYTLSSDNKTCTKTYYIDANVR